MAAKEPAMRPTGEPVSDVLDRVAAARRAEADEILALHQEVSGAQPQVWAGRVIGFGEYEYTYDSGHSGHAPLLGFASGASRHTIYLSTDFAERWPDLLQQLGPHKALLERSLAETLEQYPQS